MDTIPIMPDAKPGHFAEVREFGSNPARLRMFTYVPEGLPENAPLVVNLHGCRQTARDYGSGSGWTALASRYGVALLLPEQATSNNPSRCFNWFEHANAERTGAEPTSLHQMIGWMLEHYRLDRQRVFVTGLSAGGATASNMLALYPELFAGGAIIAGLPYRAADNVGEALRVMAEGRVRTAAEWGGLMRGATAYRGPWPRISVWHGSADDRVHPSNSEEIVKQWTDLHELPPIPTIDETNKEYRHRTWQTPLGSPLVESYTIPDLGHGAPIASTKDGPEAGGPFLIDVGISSTQLIASFFGLVPKAVAEAPPPRASLLTRVLRALGLK
jgi:poly(hydroxyalkanoate) depolymerase family esterase